METQTIKNGKTPESRTKVELRKLTRLTGFLLATILFSGVPGWFPLAWGQPVQTNQQSDSAAQVNQQLSQLESELGKYKDSAPEAANLMLKLADEYYKHGRALGLVRICQRFTQVHVNHPKHREMMLKLIDAQQVLSRNNELVVACRQFLERYHASAEAASVAIRLADTLEQTTDREGAAKAAEVVWKRHGNSVLGKRYVERAIYRYQSLPGIELQTQAAVLSEQAMEKIPAKDFAQAMGRNAVYLYSRLSKRVESNRVINRMFQRGLVGTKEQQRAAYLQMASNYEQLQQYTNAGNMYQRARQIRDDANVLYQQAMNAYNSKTNPAQTESLLNQFKQKFGSDERKWTLQQYVAAQYYNGMNKAKSLQLIREALQGDAVTHNAASLFITLNGPEPPRLQDTERVFRDAINKSKNPASRARLYRYLAFNIYTGEAFNKNRALQLCREFLSRYPEGSGDTHAMIDYLFKNSPDDNAFRNDVRMVLASRKRFLQYGGLASYPASWIQANRNHADYKNRAKILKQELANADNDALIKLWSKSGGNNKKAASVRQQILETAGHFNAMNHDMAVRLLSEQTSFYRSYARTTDRGIGNKYYSLWVRRFPQDIAVASAYVFMATDYGTPEDCRSALQHMLRLDPKESNFDLYRRMLTCAARNKDANLARQAYNWIRREEQQHAMQTSNLTSMGDVLTELKLADLAKERFQTGSKLADMTSDSKQCIDRLVALEEDPAKKQQLYEAGYRKASDQFGSLAHAVIALRLSPPEGKTIDWNAIIALLGEVRNRDLDRPFTSCGLDTNTCVGYLSTLRASETLEPAQIRQYLDRFVKLDLPFVSPVAQLLLLNDKEHKKPAVMDVLLAFQEATYKCGEDYRGFDQLTQFARSAAANQQHIIATTIGTGILANFASVDENRRKAVRDLVSRSYTQIGEVGLTIDEDSPIAPLLQAALYLRLGDQELSFDLYSDNTELFNEHRDQMPVDLVEFVVERLIAAGGDENFNYVEDLVRTWVVKNSESKEVGDDAKATMQLLLARNYFKARRFDIARSEYTTVVNRYPDTEQALEAQFGIGESFMEQKVFDQAQQVFDKLSNSNETLIVVRAEFLRGVLSFRRGDRDEARDIFRSVLERVPDVELANQTLFNLAEIYRVEERYIDQLNLLRTIGRLGRQSKSRHNPGAPLSIVVHDSDLGISRGHNRIPVIVTTSGGDNEMVYLISTGAGKGLFRGDLETVLGDATKDDGYLQLNGNDVIRCDYPEEFRAEFKSVPLSDVDIRIASNAEFEIASSIVTDNEEKTFSDELIAQQQGMDDERLSQSRPSNQVKPGNPLYIHVADSDRDLTGEVDNLVVKLVTDSGDQVQVKITETGPHSGLFEGSVKTSELPAGALATDSAINHSPLMAIDKDPGTFWLSQPDGAAPKDLTVDMKDLYRVSRVNVGSPDDETNLPVRMDLLGSYDGEFWFRLSSFPRRIQVRHFGESVSGVQQLVVMGDHRSYREWNQVLTLAANQSGKFSAVENELSFQEEIGEDEKAVARSVFWSGLFNMERSAAVRFRVQGNTTALSVDGILELPVAVSTRTVDVWLEKGAHQIQAFSAFANQEQGAKLEYAIASVDTQQVLIQPLRADQFVEAPAEVELLQNPKIIKRVDVSKAELTKKTETFAVAEKGDAMVTQNWNSIEDTLGLSLDDTPSGVYELWLEYSRSGTGSQLQIELDRQVLEHSLVNTGSYDTYQTVFAGHVMIEASGKKQLLFTPVTVTSNLMELKAVELRTIDRDAVVKNGDSWEFRFPERQVRYTKVVVNEYVGDAVAINHIEVGNAVNGELQIPTDSDILALASNDVLEIAAGDRVVATYTDEQTLNDLNTAQLLTRELMATYNNGQVNAISYSLSSSTAGGVNAQRKELMRVDPGERIVVEVADYDEDRTNEIDKITVEVAINDGEPIQLEATETDSNTGVFTREIDTASSEVEGKLTVKPGDVVYLRYMDSQNTFPGHTVPRERAVFVNEPTDAQVRIIPSLAQRESPTAPARVQYLADAGKQDSAAVAFDAPLLVEVIDPDMAKDSGSTVSVALVTTGGSVVFVDCVISNAHSDLPQSVTENKALAAGRFIGQVTMQLGGKDSPKVIPLTSEMPRGLIGRVHDGKEESEMLPGLVAMVLNLTGEDTISLRYKDEVRVAGESKIINHSARLVATGQLQITDRKYEEPVELLHVGEKIFLKLNDPDQDVSDERDSIQVVVTTELGESETVSLFETTVHSGEFTGAFDLEAVDTPTAGNIDPKSPQIETYFGDNITVTYTDKRSAESTDSLELTQVLPVVVGTDGLVAAFSKAFENEKLAVETKFRIAESYFELFKSHKELGRDKEKTVDLEAGRRILQEVMEDYPDPKYVPRISYLLGQFSQELEQWPRAIASYELILQQYGDHTLAPDAQYKLAQCLEKSGDFNEALEAYVTLAATYPKSPLIASVMIRISDHFYKAEQYKIAAQVGEKFLEKFDGHEHSQRMAFRIGQAFYKNEEYPKAGDSFDRFMKLFPEGKLSADALFWGGESYRMAKNNQLAFRRYNRCRWDFPASEAAKFARGRLALPEMLNQFEAEANSIDNDN